jgi:hypothetical protein
MPSPAAPVADAAGLATVAVSTPTTGVKDE